MSLVIGSSSDCKVTHVGPGISDLEVLDKQIGLVVYNHISTVREMETLFKKAGFLVKTLKSRSVFSTHFDPRPISIAWKHA